MSNVTQRRWYLISIALMTGAIGTQVVATSYASLGMTTMARSAQARADAQPDKSAQLKGLVNAYVFRTQLWGSVSLGLVLLAGVSWAWARSRCEIQTQRMLLALGVIYLLLLMLVV